MQAPVDSVLDPVRHARLIQDIEHVCLMANVPQSFLHRSMKLACDEAEVGWVRGFPHYRHTHAGLLLVGKHNADTRCLSICAALVRNFIDARVLPLNTLLKHIEDGTTPEPTVLVIPNLHVTQVGKQLPAWKIQQVYDLLLSRFSQGKPTVVSVESLATLKHDYGSTFLEHLTSHYVVSE